MPDPSNQLSGNPGTLPPLLPCPMCGSDKGYTLGTGPTYRWWNMNCNGCGRIVDECASDRRHETVKHAADVLRAALAAQPAEPVARVVPFGATVKLEWASVAAAHNCKPGPLYAAQPAEPVAWRWKERVNGMSDSDWTVTNVEPPDGVRVIAKEPLYAAQPAPAAVPLGWKLVPLEPFPSQRIAGAVALMKASDSDLDCTTDEIAAAYRAMIAAAGDKP